jgi:hypothetical protein
MTPELNASPIEQVSIDQVKPNPKNPRVIKNDKFKKLVNSIKEFPQMLKIRPIVVNEDMITLGGNMRLKACREAGLEHVYIIRANNLSLEQQDEFIIKDNVGYGEWDFDLLQTEWDTKQLNEWGLDVGNKGKNLDTAEEEAKRKLNEMFIAPPFSILDTRQGYWNERKEAWKTLIKNDGVSRENTLAPEGSLVGSFNDGVSIFDPVLAEIICRWFTPTLSEVKIADPFAGGAFGFVASYLGYSYTGTEIRDDQTRINNERIAQFDTGSKYVNDDGQNILLHTGEETQDLIFSCPPYYDLEVYSDNDKDASNQGSYEEFLNILTNAFAGAIKALKPNRFAAIVVGDIRDKQGYYRSFHEDIKHIFRTNGMSLYNELILIEPIGTAAQRANHSMKNRKVVKTHQNILVFHKPLKDPAIQKGYDKVLIFHKGDPKNIKGDFGQLDMLNIDIL